MVAASNAANTTNNDVQGLRSQGNMTTTAETGADRLRNVNTSITQSTRRDAVSAVVKQPDTSPSADDLPAYRPTADVLSVTSTTIETSGDAGGLTSSAVGIAVGFAVGGVILILLCLAVVILVLRRRRRRRRAKRVVRVENPQYKMNRNGNEEVMIGVGPTSIVKLPSGKANGSRKRNEAPLPPIYRPPADTSSNKSWDSLTKRKAPPPPRNLNVELYEKDSPTSSTENLKSVGNTAAAASPVDDSNDLQTDASHRQPLISSSSNAAEASRSASSPSKDRQSTVMSAGPRVSPAPDTGDADEDVPTSAGATTSLIGKKAASHASLDSYDRTKNPFFAD